MKTTAILILALVMLLCLCACTPGPDLNDATKDPQLSNGTCSHSYQEQVTTEPGCTADGVKTLTCTHCGETHTESIAMLGHDISYGKCTRCGLTQYSPIEEGLWSGGSGTMDGWFHGYDVTFSNGTFIHREYDGRNINYMSPEDQEYYLSRYPAENFDEETGLLYTSMETYTGTYTVEGDTITLTYQNDKNTVIILLRDSESAISEVTQVAFNLYGHSMRLDKQQN